MIKRRSSSYPLMSIENTMMEVKLTDLNHNQKEINNVEHKVDDWLDTCLTPEPDDLQIDSIPVPPVLDWGEQPDDFEIDSIPVPLVLNWGEQPDEIDWAIGSPPQECKQLTEWELRTEPNSLSRLSFAHFLLQILQGPVLCTLTYVESQARFFVAVMDEMDQPYMDLIDALQDIGDKLETEGVRLEDATDNLQPGTPCIARFGDDGLFYRAIVIEAGFSDLRVQYVDYGNQELVPYTDVYPMPAAIAELPARALACTLKGVQDSKLNPSMKDQFLSDFPDGSQVYVQPLAPLSLSDEFEDRWMVSLEKTAVVEEEADDDEDLETLCDSDTVNEY